MGLTAGEYTDLFEDIGALVRTINKLRNVATGAGAPVPDLPDELDNIETVLDANNRHDVLSGIPQSFDGFKDSIVGMIETLGAKADERLQHRETILEKLNGVGEGAPIATILHEIFRDMVDASQDIQESAVTIGAVSADAGNTGDGTVLTSKVLDGVSQPGAKFQSIPEYRGLDSELSVTSETVSVTCVADEDSQETLEGEERFLVEGAPAANGPHDWRTEGSGESVEVTALNAETTIANREFETWSANIPGSWDRDAGTAGTHIIQETTAADVYRGDSALRLTGDAAEASIQISQTLPIGSLVAGKRYCLACLVKGQAGTSAGTLTIQFESPSGGYTAVASEKIEMNAAALAAQTTYGIENFFINAPLTIPDDLELVIKWTGTPSAHSVRIDNLAFGAVSWVGGVGMVVLAGSTQWVKNDRLTFTLTNDDAGVFQTYFRKRFGVQLPSDAAPSISDTLAT